MLWQAGGRWLYSSEQGLPQGTYYSSPGRPRPRSSLQPRNQVRWVRLSDSGRYQCWPTVHPRKRLAVFVGMVPAAVNLAPSVMRVSPSMAGRNRV